MATHVVPKGSLLLVTLFAFIALFSIAGAVTAVQDRVIALLDVPSFNS